MHEGLKGNPLYKNSRARFFLNDLYRRGLCNRFKLE
jgi:hypothetical protein